MPHGTPDWGLVGPKEAVYGLDDLGEQAVRLGSPHLWDRRGDVVVAQDFRDGLGMFRATTWGAGAAVQLWTGEGRQGAYWVKLIGGSTLGRLAGLEAYLPYPRLSNIGLEFTFGIEQHTDSWNWSLIWRLGAHQWEAIVRLDYVNRRLEYCKVGGGYTPFATGLDLWANGQLVHTGKMVVDSDRHEYVRFLLDDASYPLPGIPVYHWNPVAATVFWASVIHISVALQNAEGPVDNVIVTQNEP